MITLIPIRIDELKDKIPERDYGDFKKLPKGTDLFEVNIPTPDHDEVVDLEVILRKGKRIGFFKNP